MRITHLAVASAVALGLFIGGASAGPSGGVVVAAATTGDVQTTSQTPAVTTIPAQTQNPTQTPAQTQNVNSPGSKVSLNPQPLPPKSKARVRYAPGTFVMLSPQPLTPKIRFTSGIGFGFRR